MRAQSSSFTSNQWLATTKHSRADRQKLALPKHKCLLLPGNMILLLVHVARSEHLDLSPKEDTSKQFYWQHLMYILWKCQLFVHMSYPHAPGFQFSLPYQKEIFHNFHGDFLCLGVRYYDDKRHICNFYPEKVISGDERCTTRMSSWFFNAVARRLARSIPDLGPFLHFQSRCICTNFRLG